MMCSGAPAPLDIGLVEPQYEQVPLQPGSLTSVAALAALPEGSPTLS